MRYVIYRTVNLINGKFYVGAHQINKDGDVYLGSGKRLKVAIKKYGRKNFKREILQEFLTEKEMFEAEDRLVSDCLGNPNCYNLKPGGYGGFSHINSSRKLTKKRLDAAKKKTGERISSYKKFYQEQKKANTEWYQNFLARNRANFQKAREIRWGVK